MIKGRLVEEMTPDERLDALAEIFAMGFEIWTRQEAISLALARKAMASCPRRLTNEDQPQEKPHE